ncbi:PTS sugar transporter subunit IIC [Faecalibacillus intestinalis]|uniref:PTS sugar transporter subunit IIC n=1 Tax=Faecalibacillus intestinalis TaxID=1982626 RepID=UPI000E54D8D0|nr:PTS transporter subunit EIIC [Faecalibacillus intestinalis]RHP73694.1 PTS sugar transporter subunit IIC [Coprobacillus sp. OF03-2AA]
MNKILNFVETKLAPPLNKMASQHHLSVVKNGMIVTVPLTIIGSIFLLIPNIPIAAIKNFFEPYANMITTVNTVTIGSVGLVGAASVAYYFALEYTDIKIDPLITAFVSVVAFLLATLTDEFTIDTGLFGTRGLFTGILVALLTGTITHFFQKKNLVIRFPDTVPPLVSKSFMSLIPAFVVLTLVWIIRVVLGINVNQVLMDCFSPFIFALNTLPGFLVFMFIRSMLWSVGIHGGAVLAVADPFFLTMFGENVAAFAAGTLPPYITASGFTMFVFLGGGGATLPLVLMMIRSKEKGFSTLGKLCLPASLFEINEPVVFGVPLVMNPYMMIPYTLSTLTLSAGTYLLMLFNIIGRPVANIPWTIPPLFSHYLVTGGNIPAVIWGIAELFIAGAIYYPFFKAMEKQRLEGNEIE